LEVERRVRRAAQELIQRGLVVLDVGFVQKLQLPGRGKVELGAYEISLRHLVGGVCDLRHLEYLFKIPHVLGVDIGERTVQNELVVDVFDPGPDVAHGGLVYKPRDLRGAPRVATLQQRCDGELESLAYQQSVKRRPAKAVARAIAVGI